MKKIGIAAVMVVLPVLCFAQNLPRVVLVPLENRAGEQYAYDVETIGELLENFINETQRLNVIDRSALAAAMAAQGRKMDDWADNAKAAEMGKALNAQYMVRGTVSRLGDNLLVSVRVLDIATAEVRSSTNTQLEHMNEAYSKMNSMAQILTYNMGLPTQQAQTAQPPTSQPAVLKANAAATGSLEIHTVKAGTVEISGEGINQTVEMPAWSSLPIGEINAGTYRVVMRYEDGKIEEKTADVRPSRDVTLKFRYRPEAHLNTLGFSLGPSLGLYNPIFAATVQATIAPGNYQFLELGIDIGLGCWFDNTRYFEDAYYTNEWGDPMNGGDAWGNNDKYFSLRLFARYAFFLPFTNGGGCHIGLGAGWMNVTRTDTYRYQKYDNNNNPGEEVERTLTSTGNGVVGELSTGVIFRNGITISATFLPGVIFGSDYADLILGGKLAFGYSYRFKRK